MVSLVSLGVSALHSPCRLSALKKLDGHDKLRTGKPISSSKSNINVLNTVSLHLSEGTILRFTTKILDSHSPARVSSEYSCMCFSNHSDIGCCTQVIVGYWIGPDPDDGWGFVEAFLNKI